MDSKSVKQSVVEGYSKLAKSKKSKLFSKLFACCDPNENAKQVGKKIGYSEKELSTVPEGSNLGVGCGNPSALAEIKDGETVIDLGSGAGFDAFIVSPLVGSTGKVIGIDLSDEMLDLAEKNAKKGNFSNIEFVKGDIEHLPLEPNIADHVISNCVINLSLNKGDVYKEAYRVLKAGGKLSISDIVLEKELPDFIKNSLEGHIACVSGAEKIETYLDYVKDAGFQDVKIESKSEFPIELMLADPQVIKIAKELNFNLDSDEAKSIASSVTSISLSARK
ncbi:MAG: arsenite methyltransferase [Saprospiraceae bacterium]